MNLKDKLLLPFVHWWNHFKTVLKMRTENEVQKWHFEGEINQDDIAQSVLIVGLSLLVAFIVFIAQLYSSNPEFETKRWLVIAQFLATPVQVAANAMLMACFLFCGSYFNRVPKAFPVAFKTMLRVMSVHPLLGLFMYWKVGLLVPLIVYGLLVPRAAIRAYDIPKRNAVFFYGAVYVSFFFVQLQSIVRQ